MPVKKKSEATRRRSKSDSAIDTEGLLLQVGRGALIEGHYQIQRCHHAEAADLINAGVAALLLWERMAGRLP